MQVREMTVKCEDMTKEQLVYFFELWARGRKNVEEVKAELLRRLDTGERWQKVDENVPECNADEICIRLRDGSELHGAILQSDGDYWWQERFYDPSQVTHWRPLPAPPSEPSEDRKALQQTPHPMSNDCKGWQAEKENEYKQSDPAKAERVAEPTAEQVVKMCAATVCRYCADGSTPTSRENGYRWLHNNGCSGPRICKAGEMWAALAALRGGKG